MNYLIQFVALASGERSEIDGRYLRDYSDSKDGRGRLFATDRVALAKRFPTAIEAWNFWRQQSQARPIRDGKPNRPLTAYTVTVCPR